MPLMPVTHYAFPTNSAVCSLVIYLVETLRSANATDTANKTKKVTWQIRLTKVSQFVAHNLKMKFKFN